MEYQKSKKGKPKMTADFDGAAFGLDQNGN
jgi:hypothetical protein